MWSSPYPFLIRNEIIPCLKSVSRLKISCSERENETNKKVDRAMGYLNLQSDLGLVVGRRSNDRFSGKIVVLERER